MSDPTVKDTNTSKARPEPGDAEKQRREFIAARDRRNKMIALGLVAFAVLIFAITAIRLMQNVADRVPG